MKHFSEQVWIDFVRGVGRARVSREIEAQLASGCPECVAARDLWTKLHSVASNEPVFTPPDGTVRKVKLGFTAMQLPQPNPWIMAKLVFDSLSQPLTAGVRSGASKARHLAFDAERTMVDLVLDTQQQSGTISLAGQVMDKGGAKFAPRQVAVILWTETSQPLAETLANEFGEFQMEFPAQNRLRLSVEIAGQMPIRILPPELDV